MNHFKQRDNFLGCLNYGLTEDSIRLLFRQAKRIKLRLRGKVYRLEERMRAGFSQQSDLLPFQERHTKLCMLLFPLAYKFLIQTTTYFVARQVRSLRQFFQPPLGSLPSGEEVWK